MINATIFFMNIFHDLYNMFSISTKMPQLFLGALYTSDLPRLREVIFYWMSLAIIGATIGYLAACKTRISLALAFGFVILWGFVFYSGID